jgi:hypothetical protein
MSPLLAPSRQQLEAQLDSLIERDPNARVLGIHSPVHRAWPPTIDRRGRRFRVVWCESELELREALSQLELDEDDRLLLVTPLDDGGLAADIAARLPKARLVTASRWDALRTAFRARELDPRLRGQEWLCDLLVDRAPAGGYPPVPGGVLDLDTAWRACLEHTVSLSEGRADASAMLSWTASDTNLERFGALPKTARDHVLDRLGQEGGTAAALVAKAIEAGQGADALAIGLACGVVFGPKDTVDLRAAAIRLEPLFGGGAISLEAGAALAEAARKVLARLDTVHLTETEARAEAILQTIRAAEYKAISPALTSGFEARLAEAASATLAAADSGSAQDAARVLQLVRNAENHDRARDNRVRLDRLRMAARLSRWLASRRRTTPGFGTSVKAYVDEGCFADWARHVLVGGDGSRDVAASYAQLRDLAQARREEESRYFAELLVDWNSRCARGDDALPIEQALDAIVAPLAGQSPVLLLVLDGLSFVVARQLLSELGRMGWTELAPSTRSAPPPLVAVLPSITEVSRASLLSGRLTRGDANTERAAFAAHGKLREASRSGKPPLLFHKADLGAGPELDGRVRAALADTGQKVVGIVHNAVDAQLSGSDQVDVSWGTETVRQLSALLRAARESGRLVILTGDHGHVIEAGSSLVHGGTGDRWRSSGQSRDGEVEIRGGRLLAPDGAQSAILAWSERIRYAAKRSGYHGGASPQEVLVPLAVLTSGAAPRDWIEAPPTEPNWWADQAASFSEKPTQPQATALAKRKDSRQPGLFERRQSEDAWLAALLVSATYAAQRTLAGRGAPDDGIVRALVTALAARGGRLSRTGLAQALGVPAFRVAGLVNATRRVLNVDQAQVLTIESTGDEVVLDLRLLRLQFDLGDVP